MSHADALARTATHAAQGKSAAVAEGYWSDPFAKDFARVGPSPGPLINRGQYARVAAIRAMVQCFLEATAASNRPAQIISLGAGLDTLFWQLDAAGAAPALFVELDQVSIVQQKQHAIASKRTLRHAVDRAGSRYHLAAADLNELPQMEQALDAAGWQSSEPTLVIAECLLVYMTADKSRALVEWFGTRASVAALVSYDMIGPHDAFGRMMVDNLRGRGCPLLSLEAVPTVTAHETRCVQVGWTRARAMTMLRYYDRIISATERARVSRLAMLDELEEWQMLLEHYCIMLAVRDAEGSSMLEGLELETPVLQPPLATLGQPPSLPSFIESDLPTRVEYEAWRKKEEAKRASGSRPPVASAVG